MCTNHPHMQPVTKFIRVRLQFSEVPELRRFRSYIIGVWMGSPSFNKAKLKLCDTGFDSLMRTAVSRHDLWSVRNSE